MYLLQHNNIVIFNDACISPFYLSVTSSVLLAKTMFRVMLASTYVCLGEFWSCWAIISFSFLAAARWNQKGAQQPFGRTASTKIHIWEPRVGATTTESTPSLTHLRFPTLRNSKKRRQKMNCSVLFQHSYLKWNCNRVNKLKRWWCVVIISKCTMFEKY